MKILLLLSLFISACQINEIKNVSYQKTPKHYHIIGKAGITYGKNHNNVNFDFIYQNDIKKLKLKSIFGLYSNQIIIKNNILLVDGIKINKSFKEWMMQKYNWVFPVDYIAKIVFSDKNNKLITDDWIINKKNKIISFNSILNKVKIKALIKQIKVL